MSEYANMTAAELWDLVKSTGVFGNWPCGIPEDVWYCKGEQLTVPEAAHKFEAWAEKLLKDKGYELTHVNQFHSTSGVKYVREFVGGVDGKPHGIHGLGPTPLHALVKAVEVVQGASMGFTKDSISSIKAAPVDNADEVTPTRQPDVARHSFTIAGKEQSITLAHQEGKPNAWVSVKDKVRGVTVDVYLFSDGLLKLRKAIDAAIERIGGEA